MGHIFVEFRDTFTQNQNGLVPKPSAAEIAANKVLRADGQWIDQSGGGGSSSHEYSTTEKLIGKWIDGKNVYEITLTGQTEANADAVSITSAGDDKNVINVTGMLYSATNKTQIGAYLNSGYYCGFYQDIYDNNISKIFYSPAYRGVNYAVTLQYTKTSE